VDVVLAYAGADAVAIDAFVAAGARGIVAGGFGPGLNTPEQVEALRAASAAGVVVVQSARVGSGRVVALSERHAPDGVTADNLNVFKARVLLMLALTVTDDRREIQRMFDAY
jgi:L-asparaginase